MSTINELTVARKTLVSSLGKNASLYFDKMKLWFQMKISKETFDSDVRSIMTESQVHLHNEFLLCLFNKIQGLTTATPPYKSTKASKSQSTTHSVKEKKQRLKRKFKSDMSNFEPADVYMEVLSQASSSAGDEPIGANRSSAQELVLPDRTFVLARLMLAAWENNMDGAEDNTAHLIIAATQIFLKNILTAVLSRRKGFSLRDQSFIYNIGEAVPSSWKKNTSYITKDSDHVTTTTVGPDGQVPAIRQHIDDVEQNTAFTLACSTQTLPVPAPLITLHDLQQTLKIHKNLVGNHTIYATNMERLFTYNTHLTWDDLEARLLTSKRQNTY